jgi:hypothetical protein
MDLIAESAEFSLRNGPNSLRKMTVSMPYSCSESRRSQTVGDGSFTLIEPEGARVGASHLTSVAASILHRISEGDDVEGYRDKTV